ncbi:ras-related protein Rab-24-like isoform X5 [Dermacentor silvarum]|uniref:ras-related protein Rab-24-like isoform X5 n=1 Tax=Dermacentor silvarum TaxID=543639 RepID=UPI0021011529|nr:ras-related protein Rab-24-like isoform X5 [Dermacentor silvarum]
MVRSRSPYVIGGSPLESGGSTVMAVFLINQDTAGSERYEAMSRIYYRGAGAAIVCFDLTDRESYQKAKFWVNELRKHEEKCQIFLCGTKNDLIKEEGKYRAINHHDVLDYADEIGAKMFETSSKTGEGIAELFCQIAKDHIETMSTSRNKRERPAHWFDHASHRKLKKCGCYN